MKNLLLSRVSLVWILLVGATALSWGFGHGFGFSSAQAAGAAIVTIAFIKVFFVIMEFMEIRGAPFFMRATAVVWLITICSILVVLQMKTTY